MLCSLCQHGVTDKIDGEPTGATWNCACGKKHCRHIDKCSCGRMKNQKYMIGDVFRLLVDQKDDDDGKERITPRGSIVIISAMQQPADNPYIVESWETGGWWFFSQLELDREAILIDRIQPPKQGDYLGLGENHTTIDAVHEEGIGVWLVEDNQGEDFRVIRDPYNDNDIRRAWKLAP